MNRDDENLKEAVVTVNVDAEVTFHFKSGGHGTYTMSFVFTEVPVAAADKAIEASAVDEIENIYIKKQTIRAAGPDKKTCIFDAENIGLIAVEKVQITRGDKNE